MCFICDPAWGTVHRIHLFIFNLPQTWLAPWIYSGISWTNCVIMWSGLVTTTLHYVKSSWLEAHWNPFQEFCINNIKSFLHQKNFLRLCCFFFHWHQVLFVGLTWIPDILKHSFSACTCLTHFFTKFVSAVLLYSLLYQTNNF